MIERTILIAAFLLLAIGVGAGCESPECRRVRNCCAALANTEWVGEACAAMPANVNDGARCTAVLHAIEAAADSGHELPEACR